MDGWTTDNRQWTTDAIIMTIQFLTETCFGYKKRGPIALLPIAGFSLNMLLSVTEI